MPARNRCNDVYSGVIFQRTRLYSLQYASNPKSVRTGTASLLPNARAGSERDVGFDAALLSLENGKLYSQLRQYADCVLARVKSVRTGTALLLSITRAGSERVDAFGAVHLSLEGTVAPSTFLEPS